MTLMTLWTLYNDAVWKISHRLQALIIHEYAHIQTYTYIIYEIYLYRQEQLPPLLY